MNRVLACAALVTLSLAGLLAKTDLPTGSSGQAILNTHCVGAPRQGQMATLEPAPEAERATCARSAYFDLQCLPPALGKVARFVVDTSKEAIVRLVKCQGRCWLDFVRYAVTYRIRDKPPIPAKLERRVATSLFTLGTFPTDYTSDGAVYRLEWTAETLDFIRSTFLWMPNWPPAHRDPSKHSQFNVYIQVKRSLALSIVQIFTPADTVQRVASYQLSRRRLWS